MASTSLSRTDVEARMVEAGLARRERDGTLIGEQALLAPARDGQFVVKPMARDDEAAERLSSRVSSLFSDAENVICDPPIAPPDPA